MIRLNKVGTVVPKASKNVKKSRIGLGFEKLDRDVFDPEKAYPFVAQTGVKWARLQSGWQRTEKEKPNVTCRSTVHFQCSEGCNLILFSEDNPAGIIRAERVSEAPGPAVPWLTSSP